MRQLVKVVVLLIALSGCCSHSRGWRFEDAVRDAYYKRTLLCLSCGCVVGSCDISDICNKAPPITGLMRLSNPYFSEVIVFIDGKQAGFLKAGQAASWRVLVGEHRVELRDPYSDPDWSIYGYNIYVKPSAE